MEENKNYLSVSEMLSGAFELSKKSMVEILKVIGIFMVPSVLVSIGLMVGIVFYIFSAISYSYSYSYPYDSLPSIGFGMIFLIFLLSIMVSVISIYANAIIVKILDDANKGNEVSWKSANKYIWSRKWSVIGLNILVTLMTIAFVIVLFLVIFLLALLTAGIGLIILIPFLIAIFIVSIPVIMLFNSVLIVRDLSITEAIGETFLLFKKGYFWKTVGRLSAISGITIAVSIILLIFEFIPILGLIIALIEQFLMQIYLISYTNIFVYDRNNKIEEFIDPII